MQDAKSNQKIYKSSMNKIKKKKSQKKIKREKRRIRQN